MTRGEHRATLWGVALLAAGMLLVELLCFRLGAAILGRDFALFACLLLPAAGALGVTGLVPLLRLVGRLLGGAPRPTDAAALTAQAAHLAAVAGGAAVAGTIGLTWVSQKLAKSAGEASWLHLAVALGACWLPALFGAASLGLVVSRGVRFVGRVLFADAAGAAGICLLVPLLLDLGAPRAALLSGLLFATAAFLFARAGRSARPHVSALATLPLAVLALLAGDLGAPWLKVRTDTGRRTRVAEQIWTAEGLIAVEKPQRGKSRLMVDDGEPVPIVYELSGKQKPAFELNDLPFAASSSSEPGPVLVVASAGAREAATALSYDHPRVDLLELHGKLVSEVLLNPGAEANGSLLGDRQRVRLLVGDGRAQLAELGRDYQFVLVLGQPRFVQAAPRLLSQHDRLYTVAALRAYLERLRSDGSLLVATPRRALPAVIAAAVQATGEAADVARRRMLACSDGTTAVLLVDAQPIVPSRLHKLDKRCQKTKLAVEYPVTPPQGRRSRQALADEVEAQKRRLAWIDAGEAIGDDKPFLERTTRAGLGEVLASLRPPAPPTAKPDDKAPAAKPTASSKAAASGKGTGGPAPSSSAEPTPAEVEIVPAEVPLTPAAVAFVAVLVSAAALLLGMLVAPWRSRRGQAPGGAPLALRASFPFFGAGLAICLFWLGEMVLRILGAAAYGWALVIPLGLVGVGAGRLWVDVLAPEKLRRWLPLALGAATAWLLVLLLLAPELGGLGTATMAMRWLAAAVLLMGSGAALGLPLAAGLALIGHSDPASATGCWGAHLGGWALGGALSAWLVAELGLGKLWPIGVVLFVLGAVLLTVGARRRPVAGASLASPPAHQTA